MRRRAQAMRGGASSKWEEVMDGSSLPGCGGHPVAGDPYGAEFAGVGDGGEGIGIEHKEVGPSTGSQSTEGLGLLHARGGIGGGGAKDLGRSEPGFGHHFEFEVF